MDLHVLHVCQKNPILYHYELYIMNTFVYIPYAWTEFISSLSNSDVFLYLQVLYIHVISD